jgi:hypothetical protein
VRSASSISASARGLAAPPLAACALAALLLAAMRGAALAAGPLPAATIGGSAEAVRAIAAPSGVRVLAADGAAGGVADRVRVLERAGLRVEVAVAPHTFFVRSVEQAALPSGFVDVTRRAAAPARREAAMRPSGSGEAARSGSGAAVEDPFQGRSDALPPLASAEARRSRARRFASSGSLEGLPYGAGWESTSELMVGSVAVPILFPESDGTVDPDRFDWTPALRDSVVRSAVRGLLRWTSLAAARGVPLTFVLEVHPPMPTRYEPIDRPVSQEFSWIEDTLEPLLGYQGDAALMAYDFANAARARLGTQWAALVFAVQNDADADGSFPDGFIAHAQLGGPWFVIPVNNLNTTSAALDFYMEHEMTHLFWALDEFPAVNAWWSCSYLTGYFNQPNWNSAVPIAGYCGVDDRCVMKGNYPDSLCALTERQVGWVDQDGNDVLDLYETRPSVRPDSIRYRVVAGGTMVVRGVVSDVAHANRNPFLFGEGDSITVATIDSLWHRMDGGPWIAASVEDGTFDEGSERFAITIPAPPVGAHRMEFRARNSSGFTGLAPDSLPVTVSGGSAGGPPGDPPPRSFLEASPTPSAGPVRFAFQGAAGTDAVARIYDVSGREARSWRLRVPPSGVLEWEWDGLSARGGIRAGGVYFLSIQAGKERLSRRVVLLR